jgi:hypothetical protein
MNTPSSFTRPVHLSLGAYGRCPHHVAITQALTQSPSDPLLGSLSTRKLSVHDKNHSKDFLCCIFRCKNKTLSCIFLF